MATSLCVSRASEETDHATPAAIMPEKYFEVLSTYCMDCHDSVTQEGKINMEELSFTISEDLKTAETWQKLLNAINSGEMPPKDETPISDEEKTALLGDLSVEMVTARKILSDSGGVIAMRRLNRREYQNTLESLLGVRPDISNLPDDQANSSFDTTGASLFFSSDQLEQYLSTAKQTLQLALYPRNGSHSKTIRIEPEEELRQRYSEAADKMRDTGARSRAFLAQTEKPASDFGLLDEYQAKKQKVQEWLPLMENYLSRPETKTGATLIMTIKQGGTTKVKLPILGEHDEGKYNIRVRAAQYPDVDERFHYLEFTSGFGNGRKLLGWRKITGTLEDPQIVEFPIEHAPGEKLQIWIHQRTHQDRGDKNLATIDMRANGLGTPPGLWVDWAEIEGPVQDDRLSNATKRILFNKPRKASDEQYAREVLHRFASRAFRGEDPDTKYMDRLLQQYLANRAKGEKSTEALIGPLAIILTSPSFLYMVESTGNEDSTALSGTELAVRLSYFLWSAPPDEELMELAICGDLSRPDVLQEQTDRLLADSRSERFVRSFTYQWLEMARLDMFQFNAVQFPTFDNAIRENAREEIFQTVKMMVAEKLPLKTLLKSDFAVVNDLLAGYYEILGVEGHEFRKVKLPKKSRRGGLLGSAAVMAMGSDGQRSSPVERGAWVLRHLVNTPPPPAPPNVPMLSRFDGDAFPARELQKAHQEQPQCAQCHRKIDPVGFALENFNAAGLWRETEIIPAIKKGPNKHDEKEFPIDPSGRLPGGIEFDDFFGLRDAVAERSEQFAQGFTEALIAYGLGRPYGFVDLDLSDAMLEHARPGDYNMNLFIQALVQSKPFQTK